MTVTDLAKVDNLDDKTFDLIWSENDLEPNSTPREGSDPKLKDITFQRNFKKRVADWGYEDMKWIVQAINDHISEALTDNTNRLVDKGRIHDSEYTSDKKLVSTDVTTYFTQ